MKNRWIFIHGGWGGSWQWKPVIDKLEKNNIPFSAPDLPGMGEAEGSHITLSSFLDYTSAIIENSTGSINLVSFSFGGMTATAMAERFHNRINKLIYIDAFVPDPGQSFTAIAGEKITRQINSYADVMGENNMIPPFIETDSRYRSHPLKTLFTDVHYNREKLENLNPVYIECMAKDPQWAFTPLLEETAAKIKSCNWTVHTLNSDHMPMYSHTEELYKILMK